jgi:hypothetical protein
MATEIGTCHICLRQRPLTYEHVPPKRAFNRHMVLAHTLNHPCGKVPIGVVAKYRAGMGVRTLCADCNGFTGRYYGSAFAEWVRQALVFADRYAEVDGRENELLLPFRIDALAVLKQIATMTLAVSSLSSNDSYYPLRRFVLMPFEKLESRKINFRTYLNPKKRAEWKEPQSRMNGTGVLMDVSKGTSTFTIADIAFPPLGYWVAWVDNRRRRLAEYLELADITHFGQFPYGKESTVYLPMPVKLPVGPIAFHGQQPSQPIMGMGM